MDATIRPRVALPIGTGTRPYVEALSCDELAVHVAGVEGLAAQDCDSVEDERISGTNVPHNSTPSMDTQGSWAIIGF